MSRPSPTRASASGKVLLLGEHAVVYGHPALAASVPRGVRVEIELGGDGARLSLPGGVLPPEDLGRALAALAQECGINTGFAARVDSDLPIGGGLGSSAALGVALARALSRAAGRPCPEVQAERLALHLERVLHGNPSGVDPAACARGGVILFRRGDPPQVEPLHPAVPLWLAVALSGVARGTRSTVLPLSARRAERPAPFDELLSFLGTLAQGGAQALVRGDLLDLGLRFDAAHGVLCALGVSCPELDAAVAALRAAGALGAKLTGAGGGGAALGLARDEAHARALCEAARLRGFEAFAVQAGATVEDA